MAKPIKSLELHYPMIQFLINTNIPQEEEVTTVFSQKKASNSHKLYQRNAKSYTQREFFPI